MSRRKDWLRIIRDYESTTGRKEWTDEDILRHGRTLGMTLRRAPTAEELTLQEIAKAASAARRVDNLTGLTHREFHAVQRGQTTMWHDWREISRANMKLSLTQRRDGVVDVLYLMSCDAAVWHAHNPGEEPIQQELDFTFDIALRRAADDGDQAA